MSIAPDSIWASSPSTTRGQPTPLSSDPKGERIAYASGKSIFLRSIDNPAISTQYTAHTAATSVARFSPSGYYVASGDASGTVRVWDCVGEGATKGEYHIISGQINDLAWDGDSQRIIAVGNGKERFGHCITADSGNSVGEITGHSSQINSVSIRQQRPLRAATVSDDTSLGFFHGAPFKFNTSQRGQHNRFVFGTAFSPDGSMLVTVGADRKIWLYDGKTGEPKHQIGEGAHGGSIFAVSWAKDSKRFVTSSADQTVKIWDAETGKVAEDWRLGEDSVISIPDHQVGVVWPAGRSDGLVISLSLSGDLNYLVKGPKKPVKVVQGHQKSITTLSVGGEGLKDQETLWTGSYDGRICSWDVKTGHGETTEGSTHSNYVSGLASASQGSENVYSVGWDDTLRTIDASAKTFTGGTIKLDSQPKGIASCGSKILIATNEAIEIFDRNGKKTGESKEKSSPTSIAASSTGPIQVAVGDETFSVRLYTLTNGLKLEHTLPPSTSAVTALAFSADGKYLATGNSSGKIVVYDTKSYQTAIDRWSSHTARITSIAWNKKGTHAVSGSLDTNIFLWSVANPGKRVKATNAHKDGVNGIAWVDGDSKVASAGGDAAVKVWKVTTE